MPKKDREEGAVDRIEERLDRSELRRVAMPDGGEVYRGAVANRALDALGARAFTVDRTIIVGDDFDPYRVEDAALYAHEMYHVEQGDGVGGGGGENFRDAEEVAARAVESLVVQRAAAGGIEAGYAAGAGARKGGIQSGEAGSGIGAGAKDASNAADDESGADADAEQGYSALLAQGMSHQEIVLEMSRRVLRAMDEQAEWKHIRQGHNKGFL
jgi:hypothetical protein